LPQKEEEEWDKKKKKRRLLGDSKHIMRREILISGPSGMGAMMRKAVYGIEKRGHRDPGYGVHVAKLGLER
jgi:hypothetical protein